MQRAFSKMKTQYGIMCAKLLIFWGLFYLRLLIFQQTENYDRSYKSFFAKDKLYIRVHFKSIQEVYNVNTLRNLKTFKNMHLLIYDEEIL